MSLKERITKENRVIIKAHQENFQRDQQLQQELTQRYDQELAAMLLDQRALSMELREIGVISLLEEMTTPEQIEIPITREEAELKYKQMEERRRAYEGTISLTEIVTRRQLWQGYVLPPEQFADGTLDGTVRIRVDNITAFNDYNNPYFTKEWIDLAYTPDRYLQIYGRYGIVLRHHIDLESPNIDLIEEGLAHAFIDPITKHMPKPQFKGYQVRSA